jgi:CBS domain-containing protein
MRVKELMTGKVSSCHPENNLAELAEMMWNQRCGALPILDDSGRVMGVITDRDICIALGTRNMRASDVLAQDVSPSRCFRCKPGDDVRDALKTMATEEVSRLPVVDEAGKLVGMISIDDVTFHAAYGCSSLNDREIINAIAAIREDRIHQPDAVIEARSGLRSDIRMPMNYGDEDFPNWHL